jgi:hypothetical protein
MNPVAVLLLLVAVLFIIVGFKGKQDNLIATVKGSPYGNSTLK